MMLGKKKMKMNKEFVPFEIAKKLKDLGFDEPCFAGYQPNHKNEMVLYFKSTNQSGVSSNASTYGKYCHQNNHVIKAPLYQQVINWLRLRHKIVLDVFQESKNFNYTGNWKVDISILGQYQEDDMPSPEILSNDYNNCIDAGIMYIANEMLNHLENQNKTHIL